MIADGHFPVPDCKFSRGEQASSGGGGRADHVPGREAEGGAQGGEDGRMKRLPKLPKRDLTDAEWRRKYVWMEGDIVITENPEPPKKSGANKKPGK